MSAVPRYEADSTTLSVCGFRQRLFRERDAHGRLRILRRSSRAGSLFARRYGLTPAGVEAQLKPGDVLVRTRKLTSALCGSANQTARCKRSGDRDSFYRLVVLGCGST
jgi:hypothetical protein